MFLPHQLRQAISGPELLKFFGAAYDTPSTYHAFSTQQDAFCETLFLDPSMLDLLFQTTQLLKERPELALAMVEHAFRHAPSEIIRRHLKTLVLKFKLDVVLRRKKSAPIRGLTHSQINAATRLRRMADLYFAGSQRNGITLRINPLLIGPSGVGKTYLAQSLAQSLDIPFLRLTVGDWLPSGSRSDPTTLATLQQHLTESPRLVLFLDELCKYRAEDTSWSMSIMTEIFSVLDRQVNFKGAKGQPWTQLHTDRLKHGVFIVGAATFQDQWIQNSRAACGFSGKGTAPFDEAAFIKEIRKARVVAPELMNRFNDDPLVLHPYTADDFTQIAANLQLAPEVLDPVAAAATGMNFRAVERAYTNFELKNAVDRELLLPLSGA